MFSDCLAYLKDINYSKHKRLRHKLMRFEGGRKIEFCEINYCEFRLYYIFCLILLLFKEEARILWVLFIAKIV